MRMAPAEAIVRIAIIALAIVVICALAYRIVIWMPGSDRSPVSDTLDDPKLPLRLHAHVLALANGIGPRNYRHKVSLGQAAAYIASRLAEYGYTPRFHDAPTRGEMFYNVEAVLEGVTEDSIVIGAHYDTVEETPGADDNASGVAGVLELARMMRGRHPTHTIRFVFFVNEEPPFFITPQMGSRTYARDASAIRVTAMLSLECIGYYDSAPGAQRYPFPFGLFYPDTGDFLAVVGNLSSRSLVHEVVSAMRTHGGIGIEGVASPSWVPGVGWSDHSSFWREGYPAAMITDTAFNRAPYYHTSLDRPETLDYGRMAHAVMAIHTAVLGLAQM